tara:strand:+ start:20438 stop:20956 length:519 start_codon:yes stop_codon:yes gene_type:complete
MSVILLKSLDATRQTVYDKFVNVFGNNHDIARKLEKAIVNYTVQHLKKKYKCEIVQWVDKRTRQIYLRKYRSILFNYDCIHKLIDKQVPYDDIMVMKHYDINPEVWHDQLKKIKDREIASMVAYTDDFYDGLLICFNCKSKKTRYTTLQTRSSDEPETVYARCLECGYNWTE